MQVHTHTHKKKEYFFRKQYAVRKETSQAHIWAQQGQPWPSPGWVPKTQPCVQQQLSALGKGSSSPVFIFCHHFSSLAAKVFWKFWFLLSSKTGAYEGSTSWTVIKSRGFTTECEENKAFSKATHREYTKLLLKKKSDFFLSKPDISAC